MYNDYLKEVFGIDTIERDYGFVNYNLTPDGKMFLGDLYVRPEHRGRFLDVKLVKEVLKVAKANGCAKMVTEVQRVHPQCERLVKLNQYHGFKIIDRNEKRVLLEREI